MALTMFLVFVLLVGIGLGLYAMVLYNSLVQVKHNVDQAFANIDVLLKQRRDELPKLIDTVRSYMVYERDLLDRITQLRVEAAGAPTEGERLQAEGQLSAGLSRLFAVAENYPDLKANQNFLQLQGRVSALEEQIAHRREFYNEAVNINNVRMEQVPDRALAGMARLQRRALFEATPQERADVSIGDALRIPSGGAAMNTMLGVWAAAFALVLASPPALAQATPKQAREQAEKALRDMNRQPGSAPKACSLLTRADVKAATGADPYVDGEPAGDWVCGVGPAQLMLYRTWDGWEQTLKTFKKDKEPRIPAPGFGERAHFVSVKPDNKYQSPALFLAAQSGAHVLALSVDVPKGKDFDAMKPVAQALMKTVLARLPK